MENNILANSLQDEDDTEANKKMKHVYKKRSGTSGVTGQLYETKLLSLILFRALKDKGVIDFCLGTNLSDIGAFDDICFKFHFQNKYVAAFIQAKHRDDPRKGITDGELKSSKSDFSLQKYFDSYLKIKQKFDNNKINEHSGDKMFSGEFENTEFCFIIYTTASDKVTKKQHKNNNDIYQTKIKDLISTRAGEHIFQIKYDESDINTLSHILTGEQLDVIVTALLECVTLSESEPKALSQKTKDILSKYQTLLIPNVLQIHEPTSGDFWEAKVNPLFFFSNDFILINLREKIFKHLLSLYKSDYSNDEALGIIFALMNDSNDFASDLIGLNKIIGNVLLFDSKSNKIELSVTAPQELQKYRHDISKVSICQAKFREVYHETGKQKMESVTFRLPQVLCKNDNIDENNIIFSEEKKIAKDFLNRLYFFTKEAKQDEVENILKKELDENNDDKPFFRMHSEAVFLKLHDKVQKWAMLQGNAFYLTNYCDFIEKSRTEVINSLYLSTLNFNSTIEFKKYNIQFKTEAIEKLLYEISSGVTNLVTNVPTLTCIKLMQGLPEEKCSFINLELVKNLRSNEFKLLLKEFQTAIFDTLVVIYHEFDYGTSDILNYILAHYTKNIIIVTNKMILSTALNDKLSYNVLMEKDNNLTSFNQESQEQFLAYNQVITQGVVVTLGQILINEECKDLLITDEIIEKILKKEVIEIGNTLEDEKYVSMKNFYLPRYLYNDNCELTFKMDDLKVIKSTVVVITAEPGMGKSTLLTHISVETKKTYPNCWIARINLLEYCSQLFKWQKERRDINVCDTMTLICKAELGNEAGDFELEITEGVLALKRCDNIKCLALLQLELIIRYYNNEAIIFIFDGFDEICPHYKKEAVKLIKNVVPKNFELEDEDDSIWVDIRTINGDWSDADLFFKTIDKGYNENCLKRIWIASRPYDSIKYTLENEFGTSFKLKPLSVRDQAIYYQKYFHANINLQELSSEQFKNIESFFEFMSEFRRGSKRELKKIHITSIPLNNVYKTAVDHFRHEILYAPIDVQKENLRKKWVSSKELVTIFECCIGNIYEISKASRLAGIPLHMHVAASYFVNEIKDAETKNETHEKWDLNLNTFDYYKGFLETKFKSIRLQEKNRRYIDCPDERLFYEKEKQEFFELHKKLAFYAMFYDNKYQLRKLVSRNELSAIKETIKKIKGGEEKTGLIYRINRHNNVPMSVHRVFAEYFAVEYITDNLKLAKKDKKIQILDLIINGLLLQDGNGLMSVLDYKLKYDEELKKIISDNQCKKAVFDLLLAQNDMTEWKCHAVDDIYDIDDAYYEEKISPALNNVVGSGLVEVTMFLLNTLEENLNEDNLETFVDLIKDVFFVGAALIDEDNIITFVLDRFRSLDSEILHKVLMGSKLRKFLSDSGTMKSNEDILKLLHSHVTHLTTRYWYFDDEIHQFQSFYYNDFSL